MPKCPSCGREIDHLIFYQKVWKKWSYDGKEYRNEELINSDQVEYACPLCDETLFYSEDGAKKFLRGFGDEPRS